MKRNMGHTDRFIRVLLAVVIIMLFLQEIIKGILAYLLLALAGIFLITAFVRFCPLYRIFGFRTCSN
ncbi:MAG TPA: DUF2892 domain-containing protein [Christiangramia sp.]|nr:DUF2892 domain-containing protein [Christiangramia sp.]